MMLDLPIAELWSLAVVNTELVLRLNSTGVELVLSKLSVTGQASYCGKL